MIVYLQNLLDERTALTATLTGLTDRAASENRDMTDVERATATDIQTRCATIDGLLTEADAQAQSVRAFADLQARIESREGALTSTPHGTLEIRDRPTAPETWGDQFVASDEFRSFQGRGSSPMVEVPFDLEGRAAITTTTAAALIDPYRGFTPALPSQQAPLTALVAKETVSSGVVEWFEEGALSVAEVVLEGEIKPEATVVFEPKTASLETIAHWHAITRQTLEDAPRIRSILDGRLRRGVLQKVENTIAASLAGIAGVNGGVNDTLGAPDLLTGIRQTVGKIQTQGYNPNAVVVNPADWAALDLEVLGTTVDGPVSRSSIWGLTVVPSGLVLAGQAHVANFADALTLFTRGAAQVYLTDSHADLFIKNTLVILAEIRAKVAITGSLAAGSVTTAPAAP